jgi:hypothetical protein
MGWLFRDSDDKEPVVQANSRGVKEDYLTSFPSRSTVERPFIGERPDFDITTAREDLYKNDPIVRAAVKKTVNKVMETGWRLEPQNGKSGINKLREKIQDTSESGLDYEKHLEEVVGNLVLYNNAFVEVIEEGGETYVNLLEPEYMEINTDLNGDVNFYFQDIVSDDSENTQEGKPTWNPDEVVHYKLNHYSTNAWSPVDLEAVYETLLIKDYIREWLHWFFKTHQMRPHIKAAENTSEEDMQQLISDIKQMRTKVDVPFLTQGEIQVEKLQEFTTEEAESVRDIMEWCDEQLLMLMQVPPIMLGKGDESGRSTASELRKQFNSYIQSIRRTVSRHEHRDLFPKLGANAVELKWETLDKSQHKEIFETVRSMRQAQMKPQAIQEYLEMRGMSFETDDVFFSREELAEMSNDELGTGNESIKGNESSDAAQSRERQSEDDVQRGNQ